MRNGLQQLGVEIQDGNDTGRSRRFERTHVQVKCIY